MVLQKVIRSNSIAVNLKKIGYIGTVHLFIEIPASTNPSQVISKVKKLKNVIIASKTRGDNEGYVVAVVRNVTEMYEQILKIKNIKGITNIEFFITVHGIEYFPRPNIIQK